MNTSRGTLVSSITDLTELAGHTLSWMVAGQGGDRKHK